MKIKLFTVLLLISFSCSRFVSPTGDGKQSYNKATHVSAKNILRMDGAYHHINKESYNYPIDYKNGIPGRYIDTPYLEQPLFFFNNGIVLFEYGLTTLEAKDLKRDILGNIYNSNGWGTYKVIKDTIIAKIYVGFQKGIFIPFSQRLECNFQGLIQNVDTIVKWRMIEPYPIIKRRIPSNLKYIEYLKNPVDLYFKLVSEKKDIDPNRSWFVK